MIPHHLKDQEESSFYSVATAARAFMIKGVVDPELIKLVDCCVVRITGKFV